MVHSYGTRCIHLQVSVLGAEPVLDVAFWIFGEAEHEVPLDLQLVNGLDGFMDLRKKYKYQTCGRLLFWGALTNGLVIKYG